MKGLKAQQAAKRQATHKAKIEADGGKRITVSLSPEAVKSIERIRNKALKKKWRMTMREAIEHALIHYGA